MSQFEQWEIKHAQDNLDIQPSNSPYWDSRSGQDDLQVIRELNLQPATTEQERRRGHNAAMRDDPIGAWAGDDDGSEGMRTSAELEDMETGHYDAYDDPTAFDASELLPAQ